jgi:hypothetical protein
LAEVDLRDADPDSAAVAGWREVSVRQFRGLAALSQADVIVQWSGAVPPDAADLTAGPRLDGVTTYPSPSGRHWCAVRSPRHAGRPD